MERIEYNDQFDAANLHTGISDLVRNAPLSHNDHCQSREQNLRPDQIAIICDICAKHNLPCPLYGQLFTETQFADIEPVDSTIIAGSECAVLTLEDDTCTILYVITHEENGGYTINKSIQPAEHDLLPSTTDQYIADAELNTQTSTDDVLAQLDQFLPYELDNYIDDPSPDERMALIEMIEVLRFNEAQLDKTFPYPGENKFTA